MGQIGPIKEGPQTPSGLGAHKGGGQTLEGGARLGWPLPSPLGLYKEGETPPPHSPPCPLALSSLSLTCSSGILEHARGSLSFHHTHAVVLLDSVRINLLPLPSLDRSPEDAVITVRV